MNTEFSIIEVDEYGDQVVLNDLSVWSISAGDSTKAACWYPTQRIRIKKSGAKYTLINLDTAGPDEVVAEKIS